MSEVLIMVEVDLRGGGSLINQTIEELGSFLNLKKRSSVFKMNEGGSFSPSWMSVLRAETKTDVWEIQQKVEGLKLELRPFLGEAQRQLTILSIDQMVQMTPVFPLPHPRLHEEEAVIQAVIEVWPDYHHPVLKKSISLLQKMKNEVYEGRVPSK